MAGIIYSDYIRPMHLFKHSDATANLTMKFTIVVIGIFCVLSGFIVEQVKSIFQVVNTIVGMTSGAVFGVFCLGMLYPRANAKVERISFQSLQLTKKNESFPQAALWSTVISMICLCWIITGSQILVNNGELQYETLDSRIDGCDVRNISVVLRNQSIITVERDQ